MAKQIIDLITTGLVIGDLTIDWVKKISDGVAVSQTSHTLTERGSGIYLYSNPNITEDSDFRIHVTADSSKYAVGYLSPADGDIARASIGIQNLFSLIESQRGSHTGKGQLIFWDPIGGNDSNSGLIFNEPKLTYNFNGGGGVHSLMTANSHDIILGLPNPGGGPTIVTEYFENDKAYNFFRGPGRDFMFRATHNESCVVLLSAEGCELSGCRVETKQTGSQDAICASGDFAKLHKVWVDYSRGSGIKLDNASSCELDDFVVQDSAQGGSGHAVHLLGDTSLTTRNIIGSGEIFENGNGGGGADGIRVDGSFCEHNFIHGGSHALLIHDNTGWGIQNVNDATHTIIVGPTVHVGHNGLGNINVDPTSVAENLSQWGTEGADGDTLESLSNQIALIPTVKLSVVAGGGTSTPAYAVESESSSIVQGDIVEIARYLEGDHSAKRLFFAAKTSTGDASYVIGLIEATNITYSAVTELTSYTIPFVADDTKTVDPGIYKGETEIRDADGASNPATGDRYDFEVIGEIIT